MQKKRVYALFLLLFIATTFTAYWQPPVLDGLRNFQFDTFQRIDPPRFDPASPVRVLAIDEASLTALGQWPWPRTRIAEIVEKLAASGAAAISFDVIFAEADRTGLDTIVRAMPDSQLKADLLQRIAGEETADAHLAQALANRPVVLGATLRSDGLPQGWPPKAGWSIAGDDPQAFIPSFVSAALPLPSLMDVAAGLGATNWLPDLDGVVRRVPLLVRSGAALMPSLSLESLRVAQGASSYVLRASNASGTTAFGRNTGLNAIKVGDIEIATGQDGSIRPRYTRSAAQRFISAKDLLAGAVDPDAIRGRIIFVGTTAVGLGDVRATPLDAVVAGVEIHAQVAEELLAGLLLFRPDWALGAEFAVTVLCLLGLALLLPRISPLVGVIVAASICIILMGGAWLAFDRAALLLDAAFPTAVVTLAYLAGASILWQSEQRAKRQVRAAFGKFVSPAVVARIAEKPELLVLSGETRELTILFSDLRGFSTLSEGLQAHEVAQFLNAYLTPMTDVILDYEGTVDKYIGDAIVAFWNAPLDVADHTRRAVDAALAMRAALARFNVHQAELTRNHGSGLVRDVRMGIGLNVGACSVGNMGSIQRFDYSALGDPVNVAARLEALSKTYGVDILATASVLERVPDYAWLDIDEIRVKGRTAVTRLYALAGNAETARSRHFQDWNRKHRQMIEASRSGGTREAHVIARDLAASCEPHWRPLYEILTANFANASAADPELAEVTSLAHHDETGPDTP